MKREALIGLFVMAGIAVMAFFIIRTNDLGQMFGGKSQRKEISITLDDASGIREGTPVRVAGVEVGRVREVKLDGGKAVAVISVPESLEFREGARVELRDQGVLGERSISLVLGQGDPIATPDNLPGQAPPGLGDITTTLDRLGDNLLAITDSLRASTTTAQGGNRMELIAANIERLTETLVAMLEENRGNVQTASGQIAQLTASLNRDIPTLVAELSAFATELRTLTSGNTDELESTLRNVQQLSDNINKASSSLTSIAQKVDEGEGTIGRLVNEGETVDKLNSLLDNANESLGEVKKLVDSASDIELDLSFRSEYLAEHSGTRNYFGVIIRPSDEKYYLIEGVSRDTDYLPPDVFLSEEQTFNADGDLVSTAVFRREEDPDDFVINGQLAYRVGNLFVKGGLFESEGGGGLEYYTLEDQLRFSLEGYDFSRVNDLNPHAKFDLMYRLDRGIVLQVGYDDFLEPDFRTVFVGGGIRWKDDDIKLLLTNAGRFLR